jgi:hypothetical protein
MKLLFRLLTVFLPIAALRAQSVRIEPSLGVASQEYRSAQEAWLHDDPSLAADLHSGKPEQIHQRIQRAAALRDEMMGKKAIYLDLIVKRFGEMRSRLSGIGNAALPVAELRKGLEEEQSLALTDQERLEALIRDLPQGDEYSLVMRELNAERTELINLQNAIALRIRSVDQMDRIQQAGQQIEAKDPLDGRLASLQKIWETERDGAKRQRAMWASLYSEMDRDVDRAKAAGPDQEPKGKTGSNAKQGKKGTGNLVQPIAEPFAVPAASARGAAPVRSAFVGKWVYESRPGAWTGFGEPVRVSLELLAEDGRIHGNYVARIPGRTGLRDLNLNLSGEVVSPGNARVNWTSTEPEARGEMLLRLGGDGRILVERTISGDTYVPRGMEVLLPR